MSEPTTVSGRRLLEILSDLHPPTASGDGIDWQGRIEHAEQEAVRAYAERMAAAVRAERQFTIGTDQTPVIEVDRVIDLIEGSKP